MSARLPAGRVSAGNCCWQPSPSRSSTASGCYKVRPFRRMRRAGGCSDPAASVRSAIGNGLPSSKGSGGTPSSQSGAAGSLAKRSRGFARLQLEQFFRILDHLRIAFAALFHKCHGFLVRAAEGKTEDRTADNRDVVGFLVLQVENAVADLPAAPFAQIYNGQIRNIALAQEFADTPKD